MKQFCLLIVLALVITGGFVLHKQPAQAMPSTPDDPPTVCQTKIRRSNLVIKSVKQAAWNQQIYWCYNQTKITYWNLTSWEQIFSANWEFGGAYYPVIRSGKQAASFQTSALFKTNKANGFTYWRPYIQQKITGAGIYTVKSWNRRW